MLLQKVTNWGHEKKYTQDRSHDWLRRSHGHRPQLPAPERININMNRVIRFPTNLESLGGESNKGRGTKKNHFDTYVLQIELSLQRKSC